MVRVPRVRRNEAGFAAADRWLAARHAAGRFSGSVVVAARGRVLFRQHYGYTDADAATPISDRTAFSLASVSKAFTGMAILLLARAGRLSLDDALARHVPELAFYPGVTVRHLLHHTSGLPDFAPLAEAEWSGKMLTHTALLGLLCEFRPAPYFAPGDAFEYSNTGYALLGDIVARASDRSYPDFMAAEIFRPLGMADTAAFNLSSPAFPLAERAFGFARVRGVMLARDLNNLDGLFGDGGIYASAADLVRWDAALRDGALLPAAAYAEALRTGRTNRGRATRYGFGWELPRPDIADHWGEWDGFTAYLRRDLTHASVLVVLSNLGPRSIIAPVVNRMTAVVARI